jgi:phosphoglycerate dehydrogenase-like enzyme
MNQPRHWRVSVPDDRWHDLWAAPYGPGPDAVDVVPWHGLDGPPPDGVDVVVLPYMGGAEKAARLADVPGLRVVQTLSAGYEDVFAAVPEGVTLATAAGVHDAATAEIAVGLAIAVLRGLDAAARDALTGTWRHLTRPGLADRRALLIGAGRVGSAIAARLAAFEVSVTRVASRARDDAAGHLHGIEELPDLLHRHDIVALACPLTDQTRGLVGPDFLAAMPDGALLVNVARGPVVATDALLAELQAGRLLAGLDVTDPEPLPADHPLWTAPGVLISPHVGGDTAAFPPRARALLRDQLERLASGRPLRNVVAGPAI